MNNTTEIARKSTDAARLEKIAETESLLNGERVEANPPKERNDLQRVEVRVARVSLPETLADVLAITESAAAKPPKNTKDTTIAGIFSEVARAPQKTPDNLNSYHYHGNDAEKHEVLVKSASYTLLALLAAQNRLGMYSYENDASEPFLRHAKEVLSRSDSSRDLVRQGDEELRQGDEELRQGDEELRQGDKELIQNDKAKYFAEDAAGYFADAQPILEALNHALASACFVNGENKKGNPSKIKDIGDQLKRYLPEGSLPQPLRHLMSDFQTSLDGKRNRPIFDKLVKEHADRVASLLQRHSDIEKRHPRCTEYIGCCLPYFEKYERFASSDNGSLFEEMLVIIEDQLAFIERNAESITNKYEADNESVKKTEKDAETSKARNKLAETMNEVSQLNSYIGKLIAQENSATDKVNKLHTFLNGALTDISATLKALSDLKLETGMLVKLPGGREKALRKYREEILEIAKLTGGFIKQYGELKKSMEKSTSESNTAAETISTDMLTENSDIAATQSEKETELSALSGKRNEIEKRVNKLNSQINELSRIADGLSSLANRISALNNTDPNSVKDFVGTANDALEAHREDLDKITAGK